MCLTETWQQPDVFFSDLNETCPPNYCYLQKTCSSGCGGGLVVIYHNHLNLSLLSLPELSSFECLAFKCKHPLSMSVLLIYRPPKPNSCFIPEMHNLFTILCTASSNIIMLGDFNVHVHNPSCHFSTEFLHLLDFFNLRQHVDTPPHTKGNILDLVITESALLSTPVLYDLAGISGSPKGLFKVHQKSTITVLLKHHPSQPWKLQATFLYHKPSP